MLVVPLSFPSVTEARCVDLRLGPDSFALRLEDGRTLEVPYECYPLLARARVEEREDFRLIGGGLGVHWPLLDEDISVAELLGGSY